MPTSTVLLGSLPRLSRAAFACIGIKRPEQVKSKEKQKSSPGAGNIMLPTTRTIFRAYCAMLFFGHFTVRNPLIPVLVTPLITLVFLDTARVFTAIKAMSKCTVPLSFNAGYLCEVLHPCSR